MASREKVAFDRNVIALADRLCKLADALSVEPEDTQDVVEATVEETEPTVSNEEIVERVHQASYIESIVERVMNSR